VTGLWDTTLASRLHSHGEVLDYVIDQAAEGTPVRVAAFAVLEIAYGYQRMALRCDFKALADALAALFPDAPALAVEDGPL